MTTQNVSVSRSSNTTGTSSHYSVAKLLTLGLIFHLVYIGSVFDCYFTSPVVHGMQSYNVGLAESKRLVLIVGNYSSFALAWNHINLQSR